MAPSFDPQRAVEVVNVDPAPDRKPRRGHGQRSFLQRSSVRRSIFLSVIVMLLVGLGVGVAPATEPVAAPAQALPSPSDLLCAGSFVIPPMAAACVTAKAGPKVAEKLSNAVAGTVFEKLVKDIAGGWEKSLLWSLSWWVAIPSPDLTEGKSTTWACSDKPGDLMCNEREGASFGSTLSKINDYTLYIQILGLICSLIFIGLRMALANRGLVEESEELWRTLARAMFAVTFLGTFIMLGMQFSDRLSTWILKEAIGDNDPGQLIKNLFQFDVMTGGLGHVALFLVLIIGVFGAIVQLALLLIRQAMLIVVVSALPIAAASSGTGPGSSAYQKLLAWTIAFLLYKPVGALVYMIAFTAIRTKSNNPQMILLGIILLGLTVFVLAALMRLIAPAVGGMGGGGQALIGGAIGGAMGKLASKGSSGGGGGGGSDGGGSSPLQGRTGGGPPPPPPPPSPPSDAGKHAAIGASKGAAATGGGSMAGGAATSGGATAGAAGGPVGAAVAGTVGAMSKGTEAIGNAASGEADAGQVNPTGSASAAAPTTSVPTLSSGSGEHRMAS